jgi:hypothetical protein
MKSILHFMKSILQFLVMSNQNKVLWRIEKGKIGLSLQKAVSFGYKQKKNGDTFNSRYYL